VAIKMATPLDSTSDSAIQEEEEEHLDLNIYYLNMVQCPLNPAHKLRRHRLPTHLVKCKKNFPDKVKCPYGHYYYLDKDKMAKHLQTCSYKPREAQFRETQHNRNANIVYNYDVENFEIDEPYWD